MSRQKETLRLILLNTAANKGTLKALVDILSRVVVRLGKIEHSLTAVFTRLERIEDSLTVGENDVQRNDGQPGSQDDSSGDSR